MTSAENQLPPVKTYVFPPQKKWGIKFKWGRCRRVFYQKKKTYQIFGGGGREGGSRRVNHKKTNHRVKKKNLLVCLDLIRDIANNHADDNVFTTFFFISNIF